MNAKLVRSNLNEADLTKAILNGAKLIAVELEDANLTEY
ncbi:MAG: pentapeptide repeat-containing protein [Arsenophonus endosymbiont of Dermacentor nuttalli]